MTCLVCRAVAAISVCYEADAGRDVIAEAASLSTVCTCLVESTAVVGADLCVRHTEATERILLAFVAPEKEALS